MNNIKAIIFDCFGVLYPQATGNFFKRHSSLFGQNASVLDKLNMQIDLGEISREQFFKGLEQETGIAAETIQKEIDSELTYDQELIKLIKKLKETYKIGLLSNAGKEEIDIIYRDRISDIFDAVAVSYEVGSTKPGAEIYLTCINRMSVKPTECIFVDDGRANLDAAAKLGIKTIHYPDFGVIPSELKRLV